MKLKPIDWKEVKDDRVHARFHFTEAFLAGVSMSIDHFNMYLTIYIGTRKDFHEHVNSVEEGKVLAEKLVQDYLFSFFEVEEVV